MKQYFENVVIFGGNGFIGGHLASYLLEHKLAGQIYLVDHVKLTPDTWPQMLQRAFSSGQIQYVQHDVRNKIDSHDLPQKVDLIVNLAAVHKQPGHKSEEYFETNILGAENVCQWAREINCRTIIFTSSIAVYGSSKQAKDEFSLTTPDSPYGISKIIAEKIHSIWQAEDQINRKLLIVRPGVIYGFGEKGNVSRMIKAILGHYFFFTGNKKVQKAGGYVKELCNAMLFMLGKLNEQRSSVQIFNFTMDPAPTLEDYAKAITKTAGVKRNIIEVPFRLLLWASYFTQFLSKSLRPERIHKLQNYNNITPKILKQSQYTYIYNLESGLKDWRDNHIQDW